MSADQTEDAIPEQLTDLVNLCDKALNDLISLATLFFNSSNWNKHQNFTLGALHAACLRTSGSALTLIKNGSIWDAEILMRPVTEGSIKFVFLLSNTDEFEDRFKEYTDMLFDIEGLKQHKKAEILLKAIEVPDSNMLKPIRDMVFSDNDFKSLSKKYPRKTRKALENKWGFTGLIQELSRENLPGRDLFVAMLHGYSMASHHIHAGYSGVSSAMECDLRETARRNSRNLAHASRIISDIFWLGFIRVKIGYMFLNIDTKQGAVLDN